ncbi:MAG: Uma2 family endonuclease [Synechococcales cyanobacterium RM1_1_8]|nr:Uma2 family endonuclease [Synechococcales cyanobacterium RM1_1_8]
MTSLDLKHRLPTSDELPSSDDTPVDNEDQNLLPNFLLFLLRSIWQNRMDWYFGVDMAIYHTTGPSPKVPVVPDGFLSLGVDRRKDNRSRKSYVLWEENDISPSFALEMVSLTPGDEYEKKRETYRKLGVLYYLIYNPEYWQRDNHQPFELYKLINGQYKLQIGEPYWMPEIGLGIGRYQRSFGSIEQEMLYWFDEAGQRYLADDEQAAQAQAQITEAQRQTLAAQQQNAQLRAKLQELGIDPDNL